MKRSDAASYLRRTGWHLPTRVWMPVVVVFCLLNSALAAPSLPQAELLEKEGAVEFTSPKTNWSPAPLGLKLVVEDRLRTLALSRATLLLAELGRLRLDQRTTLEILPPKETTSKATLDLHSGAVYFLTRNKPREFLLQTPHAIGASRGTEFLVTVQPDVRTVLTVFDGEVTLSNEQGSIVLSNGEQGLVLPGQAPVKTAVIQATNVVQWWLYYPGVLDVTELRIAPPGSELLALSISNYLSGDLRQALDSYPEGRTPESDPERVYYAGLLLSVGQVEQAEALIAEMTAPSPQAAALREVIAAVTDRPLPELPPPRLASEYLARSYWLQRTNLEAALESARQAVRNFAAFWIRLGARGGTGVFVWPASPNRRRAGPCAGFVAAQRRSTGAARFCFERAKSDGGRADGLRAGHCH